MQASIDDPLDKITMSGRALADFFEAAVAAYGQAKPVANWMLRDVLQALNERDLGIEAAALTPQVLASLIRLVDEGVTTARSARGLVPELVATGGDPAELVRERGLEALEDADAIERAVEAVVAEHAENVERYRAGEEKVLNFLIGQVMRRTGGKANPGSVRQALIAKLSS